MATLTITNPTLIDNPPGKTAVNTNNTDIVTFLNAQVIQADGSLAFTTLPQIAAGLVPVSDGQAATKYYVDAEKRNVLTARSYHRQQMQTTYATGNSSRQQWAESGAVVIPSWAVNAMATVTIEIVGNGGDQPFGDSAWQMWLSLDPSETYITAFAGDTNDNCWGDTNQTAHSVVLRQYLSVPSALKGTTSTCHLDNQRLTGGGVLYTGDPSDIIYDFLFWSD